MSGSVLLAATADGGFAGELAAAGVDRIVAYHSSVYRQRGLPSVAGLLPWASANQQTLDALPAVTAGAGEVPVVATVCANDGLLPAAEMLDRMVDLGAAGVLNAPTVGLLTGPVRAALEESGLGLRAEIDLIAGARRRGLEAWAYVFDPASTVAAYEAGATGLIVHLGITGHPTDPGRTAAEVVGEILSAVPSAGVLVHGGDLRRPADLAELLAALDDADRARIIGFFGASAFESREQGGSAAVTPNTGGGAGGPVRTLGTLGAGGPGRPSSPAWPGDTGAPRSTDGPGSTARAAGSVSTTETTGGTDSGNLAMPGGAAAFGGAAGTGGSGGTAGIAGTGGTAGIAGTSGSGGTAGTAGTADTVSDVLRAWRRVLDTPPATHTGHPPHLRALDRENR